MNRSRQLVILLTVTWAFGFWRPDSIEPQTLDLVAQGRQALDADRADEAIAILERAMAAEPKNPAALVWLGSAQVRKASTLPAVEAAAWLERGFDTMDEAVERFPDSDLSTVVAMEQARPQAVPDGVMPRVYLSLGPAQKKPGRPADARATWEKAWRLFPSAPESAAIERELRGL